MQVDPRTNETIAVRLVARAGAKANRSIYQAAQSQPQYAGMGTTLVVSPVLRQPRAGRALGDSRLYLLRAGALRRSRATIRSCRSRSIRGLITPEQAKHAQHKNLVTRRSASTRASSPRSTSTRREPGDIYLLCSDGLCDMVDDEDISMTLQALGGNLKLAAQQLVQMANDNGGRDNVSVILVRVLREYPGARGVMAKVFAWLK